MKRILVTLGILGLCGITAQAGVKEVYVGSTTAQGKQYVIRCTDGRSISGVHLKSNGYWYSVSSNMGDRYQNLSINEVAQRYCQ